MRTGQTQSWQGAAGRRGAGRALSRRGAASRRRVSWLRAGAGRPRRRKWLVSAAWSGADSAGNLPVGAEHHGGGACRKWSGSTAIGSRKRTDRNRAPQSGAGSRVPEAGRWKRAPEAGAGSRRRKQAPEAGAGSRRRKQARAGLATRQPEPRRVRRVAGTADPRPSPAKAKQPDQARTSGRTRRQPAEGKESPRAPGVTPHPGRPRPALGHPAGCTSAMDVVTEFTR